MKNILITGGSGFIGKNISESFLAKKYNIFAPSHTVLELMDEDAVKQFIEHNKIEVVLHAAAKPGHRNSKDSANLFFTNTRIFFNLARNRDSVEKIIVIGSGAIYGSRFYQPKMKEQYFDEHVPMDEHGMSKYTIGKYIEHTDNIFDLRVFGIYGKYEDYSIRFISNMVCKALFDLPLTMNQDRMFDYLWVEDLMPVIEYVVEHGLPWPAMNVTPDKSVSLSSLAKRVLKAAGKDLPLLINTPGMGSEYSGNNARLKEIMPNMQFTDIDTGISKLISYYRLINNTIDIEKLKVDK